MFLILSGDSLALQRALFNFVVVAISTMDKMLWEHILERKNMSILIDKDRFRLVLRILKVFKLIQKYVTKLEKMCLGILKYRCLTFEIPDDCLRNLSVLNFEKRTVFLPMRVSPI